MKKQKNYNKKSSGFSTIRKTGKVACFYLSAVVGAGFATGREITQFFGRYGRFGVIGLIISGILLALVGALSLRFVQEEQVENVQEFNSRLAGPLMGNILSFLMAVFAGGIYIILLAGISDLLWDTFSFPKISVVLGISAIGILFLFLGFDKLFTVCADVSPILIIIIIFAAVLSACQQSGGVPVGNFGDTVSSLLLSPANTAWILSAVLYAGYNALSAVPLLAKTAPMLPNRRVAGWGGILGALFVLIAAAIVQFSLSRAAASLADENMPLVVLAARLGPVWKFIFPVLIAMIMALSAFTGLAAVGSSIGPYLNLSMKTTGCIFAAFAIPFSFLGFGRLMDILYPLFGAGGVLFIFILVFRGKKRYYKKK